MFPILKKKIEFALLALCVYLVYAFVVQIQKEPENTREPITTINVTEHIDAYEAAGQSADQVALKPLAQREANKMIRSGDIKAYEQKLRESGILGW